MKERERGDAMSADGTYNGYANYQTWNVVLWISNDPGLYSLAKECDSYNHFKIMLRKIFQASSVAYETLDGVSWNDSSINLYELQDFWTDSFKSGS
ncbi:MAG: hypothetical protein EBX40_07630 [Gammaproteobacteria bacterium]|nr:hypothetical protein [Gammaproteobacteria bacterium]